MNLPRFAATKIRPPRLRAAAGAQRIPRPGLCGALRAALMDARVVLLQAPAGFGKTSALAAALAALAPASALAWVSLDEGDDATILLACLAAALEPLDPPWRIAPERLATLPVDASDTPSQAIAELVNALADTPVEHGVIVLDDLHRVRDPALHRALDLLIERAPAHWTLALVTRVAPPLALARLRAAGGLACFDQDQLRFTADETAALAAADGLAPAAAAALHERTAGWPAGVRLGLAAAARRPPAAPGALAPRIDRPLFDFLASEVLDQLPPALHDFLLRSSVLTEIDAAGAAAVSGDAAAADRMDEIERRGLFVTVLDGPERTLVLHDLLRDALSERLRRRQPQDWAALLRRAAATTRDPLRRIATLLRIPDAAAAELALASCAEDLLLRGDVAQVERVIASFDAGWRMQSALLLRLSAVCAVLRWDWPRAAREAEAAVAAARAAGDDAQRRLAEAYLATALYPLDRHAEAQALIDALRADAAQADAQTRLMALMADASQHLRRGELAALPALYARVLALLEAEGSPFCWWVGAPAVNWSTLPGMGVLIERYLAQAWARVGDEPWPLVAELRLLGAFNHLWAGRLGDARAAAAQVEQDLRWLAAGGEAQIGLELLRLLEGAIGGRADEVRARLDRMLDREAQAPPARLRRWRHEVAVYGVRLTDLLDGGADELARWAAQLRENPLQDAQADNSRAVFVRARHAAALGRWDTAAALYRSLLARAPRMDVMGQAIEVTLRAAHALLRAGHTDEACLALAPALRRIARDGTVGQALLAGPAVLQTLAAARWADRLAPAETATLRAAADAAQAARTGAPPAAAGAPKAIGGSAGLSEREQEVLHALAQGHSNKLIARELDISPHTVKRHVANILDKLGLASRGQAAAWLLRGDGE